MSTERSLFHRAILRAVITFVALIGVSACEDAPTPPKAVPYAPVTLYNVQHSDETIAKFPGQVEASEYSNLSFRIGGKLQELNVKAGEEVKENQLIARLDDRDAKAQLATAQSQFDVSSAMFERMEASVAASEAADNRTDGHRRVRAGSAHSPSSFGLCFPGRPKTRS